jgi:hypothetical protein
MPFVVNCPVCGADGTAKANEILVSSAAAIPIAASPKPIGLRVRAVHPPAAAPVVAEESGSFQSGTLVQPMIAPFQKPEREPNFALGILGAALGGLIGMLVWYFAYKTTGNSLGFLAIVVGLLSGFGARLLGRHSGVSMGLLTALCAFICILGTQYVLTKESFRMTDAEIKEMYDEEFADAKKLVEAIPNGTDEEIRTFLLKDYKEAGIPISPSEIDQEEIEEFKEDSLKAAQEFVSGKTTFESYAAEQHKSDEELFDSPIGQIIFWVFALGIFNIVSVCIGVGAAYRIGSGES